MDEDYGYSRPRVIGLFFLTIVMVALCLWCTRHADRIIRGVGWFGAAFFSLGFPAVAKQWFHRGPVLRLTAEGFEDTRTRYGLIPWAAVREVWIGQVYGQEMVSVELVDPEPYLARLSPLGRSIALSNRAMGFSPIVIGTVGLSVSARDLAEAMRRRAAHAHGVQA